MSIKEIKRIGIIQRVEEGKLSQQAASRLIGVVDRQVRRIVKRYRLEGEKGLIHRLRGKRSNRRHPETLKQKALQLYKNRYSGFGPTLAHEKLEEKHGVRIGSQTLRRWLIEAKAWEVRVGRKAKRHEWRARKECFGEMLQLDGSHHDWLEGRGPKLGLMGYIDDATNHVFGRFYDYEGTIPVMDSFYRYAEHYGLPQSVYLDRHSAYRGYGMTTIEEELLGQSRPESQFERALRQLGVRVIHAYSPQAKGRIERLFGTFQDRVIKEMRLLGINSYEEANRFLESYLPLHNQRFRVPAAQESNLHRSVSCIRDIEQIICIKTGRTIRRDNTIAHDKKLYQIEDRIRGKKMVVEERIDGSMHIRYKGRLLRYREIHAMPVRVVETPKQAIQTNEFKQRRKPDGNHPWRNFRFGRKERERILPVP